MELFWRENVIFPCGAILEDEQNIKLYYGAGDYSTCLANINLNDLLNEMTPYSRRTPDATITITDILDGFYGKE